MQTSILITFEEAVFGTTKTISVKGDSIKIKIPVGIEDGMRIKLAGRGGEAPTSDGTAGDLYVEVHVKPHKSFVRDSLDRKSVV